MHRHRLPYYIAFELRFELQHDRHSYANQNATKVQISQRNRSRIVRNCMVQKTIQFTISINIQYIFINVYININLKLRSATHINSNTDVAIKNVGSKNFGEVMLAKRALRELKLLRHLNGHENVH